jgi:hypothetical protein
VPNGVTIAVFNPMYDSWPALPADCATPATFTKGEEHLDVADAVVFHMPSLDLSRFGTLRKPAGQIWVAWSQESRARHPEMNDPRIHRRIDLEMTYERTSDVWHPYFASTIPENLLLPPTPKTADAPAVWLQSSRNDTSGRKAYFAELARRIKIDSFGDVGRNREERIPRGWTNQFELYRQYKFTLAFENSFARDYVTEKFWLPLRAGSVPVYRGTEDIAALAPTPDCYIDARDFASATELGAHLDHLDRNDDEYAALHAWRSRDVSPSFKALLAQLDGSPFCRLAALVSARRSQSPRASGRTRPRFGTRRR